LVQQEIFYQPLDLVSNVFSYDQHTNSLVFIHRNNPIFFGGTNSTLRYDYSTDGGASWTNDIGTLAPDAVAGVNGARYPQVVNYNQLPEPISQMITSCFMHPLPVRIGMGT
jgi:hypothetical protein